MIRNIGGVCVIGLLLLSLTACEGNSTDRTVPVEGKVTVNGHALTHGSVVYWPDEAQGNKLPTNLVPTGQIATDGSYELRTKGKPGAPPGAYKVTVVAQTKADPTSPDTAKNLVAPVYTSSDRTPLVTEVTENAAPGSYDLAVK